MAEANSSPQKKQRLNKEYSTLVSACRNGDCGIVEGLLTYQNANSRARSCGQRTLLMIASENGHLHIVHALLSLEADVHARDLDQSTALILASSMGHTAVVGMLLNRGADVNAGNLARWTALIAVSAKQQFKHALKMHHKPRLGNRRPLPQMHCSGRQVRKDTPR
jgi:ankyrin repeat protein